METESKKQQLKKKKKPDPLRLRDLPWNWPQAFGISSTELYHFHNKHMPR
jgi:hypothetical protein